MAKTTDNVLLHGVSGTFGGQIVFRQRMGKSIMCKPPKKSDIPPTPLQSAVRERFQMGVQYARSAKKDPEIYAAYRAAAKNGQSAYNVALADCFNAPEIREIDTKAYAGKAGDKIRIRATDDFLVKSVQVYVLSPDGTVLEEGAAAANGNGLDWYFSAKKANPQLNGSSIRAEAADLAGNVTLQEITL